MKKFAVAFAIYNRHDLERLVIERLLKQSKKFGFEVVVCGSEGTISEEVAEGCHYVEYMNFPVSDKHNYLLEKVRELDVDGVVMSGSDDIFNDEFFEYIYTLSPEEENVIGLKECFFYSTRLNQAGHWKGYKDGTQSVGAGRFFSKKVLEQLDYRLFGRHLDKGLDSSCNRKLVELGIKDIVKENKEINSYVLDIKHTQSLTRDTLVQGCEPLEVDTLKNIFGKDIINKIKALNHKTMKNKAPNKIRVKITKGTPDLPEGTVKALPKIGAKAIVEAGYAVYYSAPKKEEAKKAEPKKPTAKKAPAKKAAKKTTKKK